MKENTLVFFDSDVLASEQFAETTRRSQQLEPEKALLLAVLEDATDCYLKYHAARDRFGKVQFHEAEEWIMQSGNDWLFSFENVCEHLGLDPEYIRRGLRQWSAKSTPRETPPRHRAVHRHAA